MVFELCECLSSLKIRSPLPWVKCRYAVWTVLLLCWRKWPWLLCLCFGWIIHFFLRRMHLACSAAWFDSSQILSALFIDVVMTHLIRINGCCEVAWRILSMWVGFLPLTYSKQLSKPLLNSYELDQNPKPGMGTHRTRPGNWLQKMLCYKVHRAKPSLINL